MVMGSLLAALIARVFKLVGLSPVDRILAAAFGLVRGSLVVIIATMCLMAFAPELAAWRGRELQAGSVRDPGSRVLTIVAPFDLKEGFNRTFDRVQGMIKELRHPRKLILPGD